MRYRLIRRGVKHHHFYEDLDTNRIVIADHSGDDKFGQPDNPEHTDDGVLYVDFERKINLLDDLRGHYAMPLKKPNGELCSTIVILDEVHWAERRANRRFGERQDSIADPSKCFHHSLNLRDKFCAGCGKQLL